MCNKSYKLLLLGSIHDNHMYRFITNLKTENPNAEIDILDIKGCSMPQEIEAMTHKIILLSNPPLFYKKIKGVYNIIQYCGFSRQLKSLQLSKYDIINIHSPNYLHLLIYNSLKRIGYTILLTPWGSDVYRIDKIKRFFLSKLYKKADWICGTDNRFSQDVKHYFNLGDEKIVNLDIGSDTIDYISEHIDKISREDAKCFLGIKNKYVITCGYNGTKLQNHEAIIAAIIKIKEKLSNFVLLFPMTYNVKDSDYIPFLKKMLNDYNIESIFFEKYLNMEELFMLRRATDMFIHVQKTDANSAAVQEYLLCGAKVVNGKWLRYSEIEKEVIPYFLVKDLTSLSSVILEAYSQDNILTPPKTIEYIKSYGWKQWIKKWNTFFESFVD